MEKTLDRSLAHHLVAIFENALPGQRVVDVGCEPYTVSQPLGFSSSRIGNRDRPVSVGGAWTPAHSRMVGRMSIQLTSAWFVRPRRFCAGENTISGKWTPGSYSVVLAPGKGGPLSLRKMMSVSSACLVSLSAARRKPTP